MKADTILRRIERILLTTRPLTAIEIADETEAHPSSVASQLSQLASKGEVSRVLVENPTRGRFKRQQVYGYTKKRLV